MFKNEGGGVNGCLNNVKKNCGFGDGGHPLVTLLTQAAYNRKYRAESCICIRLSYLFSYVGSRDLSDLFSYIQRLLTMGQMGGMWPRG